MNGYFVAILFIQQVLGGLAFPVAKYGLAQIDPFTFAFFRFVLAAIALLTITKLRKNHPPVEKRDYIKIVGLGALIIFGNQTAYLFGQKMTAASHASLIFATVPIWLFIAALLHLKEKFVLRRGIGVALGLIGVLVIIRGGAVKMNSEYLWGDLVVLIAVLAWVYYTVWGKPLVMKYGALRVTAYCLTSGAVLYAPFGLYCAFSFDYRAVAPAAWLSVIYMALGLSVAAYVLWYWLLKHFEASRLAVFQNIQPVFASAAAIFFLGEPLDNTLIFGGLIVLTGVIITESRGPKQPPKINPAQK
ncbi:DMT family transporter [Acidobacteriota bacterium]